MSGRVLAWVVGVVLGCSASDPNVRVRRLEDGRLEVDGPLAGPFKTTEELAERACVLMTSQPGASNGLYGFEYCALHYYSSQDDSYFLSYLSDIGGSRASGQKFCELPRALDDPGHTDAVILGGAHSHPHNRKFSGEDTSPKRHWRPTRMVDASTGRIWDRELLLFFREKSGECRAYRYNNTTRVVEALRDGQWTPIGEAVGEYGEVRMFEGRDWLP